MGSTGLSFDIKRIRDTGDPVELFYELKDSLLDFVWNITSSMTGFQAYLNSEDFSTWMSDRWDHNETYLYFAFWEDDVDEPICAYAIHSAAIYFAYAPSTVKSLCEKHGFEIDLSGYSLDRLYDDFGMHGSSRVCRVLPWRRGEPIDAEPRFECSKTTPHKGKPPTKSLLRRIRGCAMTGLCACTTCNRHRTKPGLNTDAIALAWQALDSDPIGVKLSEAVGWDTKVDNAALGVLGDWLEEHDAKLDPATTVALAYRYTHARPDED